MVKGLLLDAGGVLIAPPSGDWLLGPGYEAILGIDFAHTHLDAFRRERRAMLHLLPDTNVVDTDDEEYAMFIEYYRATLAAIGLALTQAELEALAHTQVYADERYTLFEDVLPYLDQWKGRYRLGIVSDAPPSTRRILATWGVLSRMDGATFSCELGVLKPDPAMYNRTLSQLGIAPEETVFVDDLPGNLHGAQALGIRAVQMLRIMPDRFARPPAWDGPIAHSFAELDKMLDTL